MVFQPTFFFCVLLWTWYFCPPTDLLLVERYPMTTDKTVCPKWHKWEHVFRTIEKNVSLVIPKILVAVGPEGTQVWYFCCLGGHTATEPRSTAPQALTVTHGGKSICLETRFSQDQDIMIHTLGVDSWSYIFGFLGQCVHQSVDVHLIPFSALSPEPIPSYVKRGQYFSCCAC